MKDLINRIELWLNIVHYCIYKADYKLHMLSNKLNPFFLLGKIPRVKRKFEEQGTTHEEVVNKVWTDRRYGFGIMISGGGIVLIVFLLLLALFDMANSLVNHPIPSSWHSFLACIVLAYLVCYFTIFKKDKYIQYFKQFDKMSKKEKRKYGLLSLAFVVATFGLWIYSFRFIPLS